MSFNSLFFLLVFLPASLLIYYGVSYLSKKNVIAKRITLLVLSLFFYCYASGFIYFGVLIGASLIHYLFAYLVSKSDKKNSRLTLMWIDISLSALTLLFFKYINLITGSSFTIIFPLALSFYTFQSISYMVNVYKREIDSKEVNILSYFLYLFIFMKLTQGPITEYNQIKEDNPSVEKFYQGIIRFAFGLAKKILIADTLALVVSLTLGNISTIGTGLSWFGLLAFTLQLYFDFSGYSDMAIGIGKMFGYDIAENFNAPYLSLSIGDFWRRWHMSLGNWFKRYIYIPLGGNRKGTSRTCLNLFIVFFLTGIWHGSTLNFLIWGVYFAFFSILEKLFLGELLKKNKFKFINWLYTIFVVMIGWVLFICPNFSDMGNYFKNLFGIIGNESDLSFIGIFTFKVFLAVLFGLFFSLIYPLIKPKISFLANENKAMEVIKAISALALVVVAVIFITSNNFSPSIYGAF